MRGVSCHERATRALTLSKMLLQSCHWPPARIICGTPKAIPAVGSEKTVFHIPAAAENSAPEGTLLDPHSSCGKRSKISTKADSRKKTRKEESEPESESESNEPVTALEVSRYGTASSDGVVHQKNKTTSKRSNKTTTLKNHRTSPNPLQVILPRQSFTSMEGLPQLYTPPLLTDNYVRGYLPCVTNDGPD